MAAIAASSACRRRTSTATGPSAPPSSSWPGSSSAGLLPEHLGERLAELRALPLVLVLEIDEGLAPARRVRRDLVGPARDVGGLVALVAQAEVAVVGGLDDRRGLVARIRDAQGQVARPQALVDRILEPRGVAELEGRRHLRRQRVEERVEDVEVALQVRRQLEQQRRQAGTEAGREIAEAADEIADVLEAAIVGDALGRLQCEAERLGRRG